MRKTGTDREKGISISDVKHWERNLKAELVKKYINLTHIFGVYRHKIFCNAGKETKMIVTGWNIESDGKLCGASLSLNPKTALLKDYRTIWHLLHCVFT